MHKTTSTILVKQYFSPCGNMAIGSYADKICLCNWLEEKHPGRIDRRLCHSLNAEYKEGSTSVIEEAIRQLDEYFEGKRKIFDLPLLLTGTEFQKQVWNALLEIPFGETATYGTLAGLISKPKAVRAVANANGANAISIIIPCHRIIGSGNNLTGYGGGLKAKKFLLELEARHSHRR